jgi:hypothetical protein
MTSDAQTRTTQVPEHLEHYEYGTEPWQGWELEAVHEYEQAIAGIPDTIEGVDAIPLDADWVRTYFDMLSTWYGALDTLKSTLRIHYTGYKAGPAHSVAGSRFMSHEVSTWFRWLNRVRREACRLAFGTAGPQPEMDADAVTFGDIPGVRIDGSAVAEYR